MSDENIQKALCDIDNICCIYRSVGEAMYDEVRVRLAGRFGKRLDDLTARLAAAEAALTEANRRLAEIRDELCGNGLEVAGWHQNGELEPLDSWFEHNEWGPVEAAKAAGGE